MIVLVISLLFGRSLKFYLKVRCLKKEFENRQFPETAAELFEREATFRNYNNSLELTVFNYNFLKMSTRNVEFDLISGELDEIDKNLERAEHALNWNSERKCKL